MNKRNASSDRIDNRSILDQSKERRKLPAKWRSSLRAKKQNPSVVKPARLWSPAPAAAIPLLSSGWAEARTSSTDKTDLYLLTSLSSPAAARGPTAAVSDRRTVRSPSP